MATVRVYASNLDGEPPPRPQAADANIGMMPEHSLRRTGSRPIRFRGVELCSATGHSTEGQLWHEINLFRSSCAKIVVDIRVFKKSPTEKDCFYGTECDTMEEAAAWLEAFDPRQDVPVDFDLDDPKLSIAELCILGATLRMRMEEASRRYKTVLGELLFALRVPA